MTSLLTTHINLPFTYTNDQGKYLTLAVAGSGAATLDHAVTFDKDLNLWQLDGLENIETKVKKLTGMSPPKANQFSQKTIGQDPHHELLVWQGVNRFLWLTQTKRIDDSDKLYAINQTSSKIRLSIVGSLARSLLRRGLQVDISDLAMPQGACFMTHIEHIGVTVLRMPDINNQPAYQVWVMRGFAISLFEFLQQTAYTLTSL